MSVTAVTASSAIRLQICLNMNAATLNCAGATHWEHVDQLAALRVSCDLVYRERYTVVLPDRTYVHPFEIGFTRFSM